MESCWFRNYVHESNRTIRASVAGQPAASIMCLFGSHRDFRFTVSTFLAKPGPHEGVARQVDLDRVHAFAAQEANGLTHFIDAVRNDLQALPI